MSSPIDSRSGASRLPNLEQQRKRAKDLRRAHARRDPEAARRLIAHLPRAAGSSSEAALEAVLSLSEAQLVVAREAGFTSWPAMKRAVEQAGLDASTRADAAIMAALRGDSRTIAEVLALDRELPGRSIGVAAALLDRDAVERQLDETTEIDARGGPYQTTALVHACCSRLGVGEPARDAARLEIVRALLAAGAKPSEGMATTETVRGWRSAAGGAVACARSATLLRLLVEAGADPADGPHAVRRLCALRGGAPERPRLREDPAGRRAPGLAPASRLASEPAARGSGAREPGAGERRLRELGPGHLGTRRYLHPRVDLARAQPPGSRAVDRGWRRRPSRRPRRSLAALGGGALRRPTGRGRPPSSRGEVGGGRGRRSRHRCLRIGRVCAGFRAGACAALTQRPPDARLGDSVGSKRRRAVSARAGARPRRAGRRRPDRPPPRGGAGRRRSGVGARGRRRFARGARLQPPHSPASSPGRCRGAGPAARPVGGGWRRPRHSRMP